jgi:hypothetical protein
MLLSNQFRNICGSLAQIAFLFCAWAFIQAPINAFARFDQTVYLCGNNHDEAFNKKSLSIAQATIKTDNNSRLEGGREVILFQIGETKINTKSDGIFFDTENELFRINLVNGDEYVLYDETECSQWQGTAKLVYTKHPRGFRSEKQKSLDCICVHNFGSRFKN